MLPSWTYLSTYAGEVPPIPPITCGVHQAFLGPNRVIRSSPQHRVWRTLTSRNPWQPDLNDSTEQPWANNVSESVNLRSGPSLKKQEMMPLVLRRT
jgi:hypothetical protein